MNHYHRIKDFHGTRATGVGSSDIATLAGYTQKYGRTTYSLFREKTGREKPFTGNRFTYWGNQLEGLVLREWIARRYGRAEADKFIRAYWRNRDRDPFRILTEARHPEYPFALAHADLLIDAERIPTTDRDGSMVEGPRITEAKSHSFFGGLRSDDLDSGYDPKDRSQNGIPAGEFLQVQWQEFVYDVARATLATLIDTSDYREYGPVVADPRVQEKCLALAERFWWHVENDVEPKPETWDDVATMWPSPEETQAMYSLETVLTEREFTDREGNTVTYTGTLLDMLEEREKVVAEKKRLSKREAEIKVATGVLMGENKYLVTPDGTPLATRVRFTREDVTASKVKESDPELWEKFKADGYVSESVTDYPKFRKVKR